MKKILTLILIGALVFTLGAALVGCNDQPVPEEPTEIAPTEEPPAVKTPEPSITPEPEKEKEEDKKTTEADAETKLEDGEDTMNPIVTIKIKDAGEIKLELYPDKAPNTVNNFINLINKDFYNGVVFHRIVPGFMIQGGDPTGTGMGGPGYGIKGEFAQNGFTQNDLSHTEGTLSMARSQHPDSAGSQFFITDADALFLDDQYAPFGRVIDGLDLVKEIALDPASGDTASTPRVIERMTVDTKGVDYPAPEIIQE